MFRQFILYIQRKLFNNFKYYPLFKKLYFFSLKGMGVLNYENEKVSGEHYLLSSLMNKKLKQNDIVFDVGANVGNFSNNLLKLVSPKIDIYSFEPNINCFKSLLKIPGISSFNIGFGAKREIMKLYDYSENEGSEHATLIEGVLKENNKNIASINVQIDTIDRFCNENNIEYISLLKIDTEGYEYDILNGSIEMLNQNKIKYIYFEFGSMNIHRRIFFKDFEMLLRNYSIYRMLPNGLLPLQNEPQFLKEIFVYQNILAINKYQNQIN